MKKSLNELTKDELIELILKQKSVYSYCLKRFGEMARDIGYESVASLALSFADNYGLAESFFSSYEPIKVRLTVDEIKFRILNLLREREDFSRNLSNKVFYKTRYQQKTWWKAINELKQENKIESFGRNKGLGYRLKKDIK